MFFIYVVDYIKRRSILCGWQDSDGERGDGKAGGGVGAGGWAGGVVGERGVSCK